MERQVVLTDQQELGLAVKLQEENARRQRPVLVNGRPTRMPQIDEAQYVQAIIEDIAEQGVKQLAQLDEAQFSTRVKAALADPVKRAAVEAALG